MAAALPLERHQKGTCGHLRIRVEPGARARGVSAAFGAEAATMKGRKGSFYVAVRKAAFAGGAAPRLVLRCGGGEARADVRALLVGDAAVVDVACDGARFWVEYRP